MSEMDQPEKTEILNKSPEAYLAERQAWMREAVAIIAGDPEADPSTVFPDATEVRADGPAVPLTEEQEASLREVAGRFGIGGEVDITCDAKYQILEGGKPWKIEAEAALTKNADTIMFAGSTQRRSKPEVDAPFLGQDETDYMLEKYGVDLMGKTEYDMVRVIAESQRDFVSLENDEVLPFGYDIHNNHSLMQDPTGQFVKIGMIGEKEVILLRVDRDEFTKEDGKTLGYKNQPNQAALMGIVADVLTAGGQEAASIGVNTSNTYASRAIDVVLAGLKHGNGHSFAVGMYGRQTLAEVKGSRTTEPSAINQIPGELHVIYGKLERLKAALEAAE